MLKMFVTLFLYTSSENWGVKYGRHSFSVTSYFYEQGPEWTWFSSARVFGTMAGALGILQIRQTKLNQW